MSKHILTTALLFAFALTGFAKDKYRPIFDGKTLKGWTQRNGTATYRVEDNAIVGKTKEGSPNSFLCTDKLYGDFDLKFEVKVVFANLLSASMLVIDNGRWQPIRRRERLRIELDSVITDENDLKSHLVSILGATPVHFDVRSIDFVRETMRIDVIIERRLTQD